MPNFSEYKGELINHLPFDIGDIIFSTNMLFSSSMMDEYVYQNENKDLFFVKGVLQRTATFKESVKDDTIDYHLVLTIPIKSNNDLKKYLNGETSLKTIFDENTDVFIMKLGSDYKDGDTIDGHINIYDLLGIKKCSIKDLPYYMNPYNKSDDDRYNYRGKLSFVFNSDEDKDNIDKFIKNN